MIDLVERLRDADTMRRIGENYADTHERRQRDRDEAAARIEKLEAEADEQVQWVKDLADLQIKAESRIAQLEAALREIASGKYSGIVLTSYPPQDPAVNAARAAIAAALNAWPNAKTLRDDGRRQTYIVPALILPLPQEVRDE